MLRQALQVRWKMRSWMQNVLLDLHCDPVDVFKHSNGIIRPGLKEGDV